MPRRCVTCAAGSARLGHRLVHPRRVLWSACLFRGTRSTVVHRGSLFRWPLVDYSIVVVENTRGTCAWGCRASRRRWPHETDLRSILAARQLISLPPCGTTGYAANSVVCCPWPWSHHHRFAVLACSIRSWPAGAEQRTGARDRFLKRSGRDPHSTAPRAWCLARRSSRCRPGARCCCRAARSPIGSAWFPSGHSAVLSQCSTARYVTVRDRSRAARGRI